MLGTIKEKITNIEHRNHFFKTLLSGIVIGFLQLMIAFSLASLLFSGDLSPYLAQGLGIFLITLIVSMLISAIISKETKLFPSMQSSLVLIMVGIVASFSRDASLLPTTIMAISLACILSGFIFFIFGHYKWVQFIRYIPYPVIGGFLAGNGWLLIQGGLLKSYPDLTTGLLASVQAEPQYLIISLVSLVIGIMLTIGMRRNTHYAVMPIILLLSSVAIHIWIALQSFSMTEAAQMGILISNLNSIDWMPSFLVDASLVKWQEIAQQSLQIGMIVVVGLIHMSLNISSMEIIKNENIDINSEVQSNGIINIIIGCLGGFTVFQSTSASTLNHKIGTNSRFTYIVAAGFIGGILIIGTDILRLIPVSVLGGLLIYVGIDFVDTWVIQGLHKFNRQEYIVVILIMFVVVFVGILEGFVLGIVVMLLVFIASYSRVNIIHRSISAENLSSTIEHTPYYDRVLQELRHKIYLVELSGFLFFGTSNHIVSAVEEHLSANIDDNLRFLIIDFRRVTGIDSSTLLSLNKVTMLAEEYKFNIYLSGLDHIPQDYQMMSEISHHEHLFFASDLDEALGACENGLLDFSGTTQYFVPAVVWLQLVELGMSETDAKALCEYMKRMQYKTDEVIIRQGDTADCIYLLEMGQVSVFLQDGEEDIRLKTINMGSLFGEISFLLGRPRSATIISNTSSTVWKFMHEDLAHLKQNNPQLAFAFEHMMLTILAERLIANNQLIQVLR